MDPLRLRDAARPAAWPVSAAAPVLVKPRARYVGLSVPTWLVVAASLVYLGHLLIFGNWIIDDAGISFAYARNFAFGHGLVSQPGVPPVEGYSNPLWVFLLALFFRLGLFHSTLTPKLLSLLLVVASFGLLERSLRRLTGGLATGLGVLALLSVNSDFAVWTCSGLETPLYVFLLSSLFAVIVNERLGSAMAGWRVALLAALLAVGLALTRPDAIVCAALYPLLTVLAGPQVQAGRARWREALRRLAVYSGVFVLGAGLFELGRIWYFGQPLPNTYYAKGLAADGLFSLLTLQVVAIVKLLRMLGAVADRGSGYVLLGIVAGLTFCLARRSLRFVHGVTGAFAGVTTLAFLLLPIDWMPGFRFATPALPFLYAFCLALIATVGSALLPARLHRRACLYGLIAAITLSLTIFVGPSLDFASNPTVPFAQVAADYGLAFNRYAELLKVKDGSILLPDLGGTLYTSRLRVYDLVGLCDRTIGRTLLHDRRAFHEYIFGVVKPTFIHTHEYWTAVSFLESDPRFRQDYVPLLDYVDPKVYKKTGLVLRSGDFVLRSVAAAQPHAVAVIHGELERRYWREIAASQPLGLPAEADAWRLAPANSPPPPPPPDRGVGLPRH